MRSIRNLPALLGAAAIMALSLLAGGARSADQPKQPSDPKLDTVTIQAARERKALQHRIDHFVSSVVVSYGHDSLVRWDQPMCPLVAGLPRGMEEFILARISQIATTARAPLAGEHCNANLYVIATPYPDLLLKKWEARNPGMYRICNGVGGVKAFMNSRSPIRVWYNITWASPHGRPQISPDAPSIGLPYFTPQGGCVGGGSGGTRLSYGAVQALSSVFIIVDLKQTKGLTIGQLADYVALIGLAQVRPEADPGNAPTILTLFRDPEHPPQALSAWDRALLYSLYNTRQASTMEVPLIRTTMLARIAPTP